ncbi:TPA: hypothetical protein N0F65_008592 [Lagenidium giganteum]|uniref:DNA helicase Pif1-like 2B domain-containing protein n=1 Tax=Lagenidium giganteum TaxID=4803 RepID=A0AAV2Z2A2_9STRA|nr:TPA: hypothetical protein N0F65_008592 [Lagenidium giganteum]
MGWAARLLEIGGGIEGDDVLIPDEIARVESLSAMIEAVYGDLQDGHSLFSSHAILTPLNKDVKVINDQVLDRMPGQVQTYQSIDSIPPGEVQNQALYPAEYLNSIDTATLPLSSLRLKIGCVVILLRNLDASRGLCNGTRLRVDRFFPTLLQVTIISQGAYSGSSHFFPLIALYPSDSKLPFSFNRLQFPVRLAFAMPINEAQGQTLDKVGLFLPSKRFTHGHFYVALSRTRTGSEGIYLYTPDPTTRTLNNVVFREVFQRLHGPFEPI